MNDQEFKELLKAILIQIIIGLALYAGIRTIEIFFRFLLDNRGEDLPRGSARDFHAAAGQVVPLEPIEPGRGREV